MPAASQLRGRSLSVSLRDRCAIAGIGATSFSRDSQRSVLTLATEAALDAVEDAAMDLAEIDGVICSDYDEVIPTDLAHSLGLDGITYWGTVGSAGAAPCAMIGHAMAAIIAGMASNVLVFRALNGRSGPRFGAASPSVPAKACGGNGTYDEFISPYGLLVPGQMWALIARRHMIEYGSTAADRGAIALACRRHANANPAAMMYGRPLTMDAYLGSRMLTDPLRINDYSLESDGACAVVVTSAERAGDCPQPTVLIRAVAQGTTSEAQPGNFYAAVLRPAVLEQPSRRVAELLYRRAGLGPGDIDVAQFYDCFTISVMIQLEDYGFCARGEGGAFASSGALEPGGRLPITTAGGNLSEAYIHGMTHVLEGVRQMRGTSTSQVAGAETCLVTSAIPTPTSALILRAS